MTIVAVNDGITYTNPSNLAGAVAKTVLAVNANLNGPLSTTNGLSTQDVLLNPTDLTSAVLNISSATTTPVVAAVAAQKTRVYRLRMNVGAANTVTVKDGSTVLETLQFTGAGFLVYDFSSRPWYSGSANTAFNLTTSTAAQVNGVLEYVQS